MLTIYAQKRLDCGTNNSRKLRLKNKFPAVIYGCKRDVIHIELDHDLVFNFHEKAIFCDNNLVLVINDVQHHVKVKTIHHHVFKPKLLHIDFIRIS